MTSFQEFVADLARDEMTIAPAEVSEMRSRFGDKVLQMGHLQPDGSIVVPVDCIVAATRSSASKDAASPFSEEFVDRVSEARRRKLERLVERFQSESDSGDVHRHWKEIEKLVFGVEFED
jgi:hypothetical protein